MKITVKDNDSFKTISYTEFEKLVKITLYNKILELTSESELARFKTGKVTLSDIGICNGVAILIDKDLQNINDDLAILDTDTLNKFISDLERDFKNKQ